MKHVVGEVVTLREDLCVSNIDGKNSELFRKVFPIEVFFRGCSVEVVRCYDEIDGYGVKYKDSREFFTHESHIKEV